MNTSLSAAFESAVRRWCDRHRLAPRGSRILAAVSGGADSMAMLHALAAGAQPGGYALGVAHFDHGLRGRRGAADARFVAAAARALGLPVVLGRAPASRRPARAPEAASRAARYDFLARAAARCRADRAAVAHTADDQAETVVHRLCRGAGLPGAAGMRPVRPLGDAGRVLLIRPLLDRTRAETRAYVRARAIAFREDETNRSPAWTRNRIRRRIMPLLEKDVHRGAAASLARFAALAADAADLVAALADGAERTLRLRRPARRRSLPCATLARLPAAVRAEAWRRLLARSGRGVVVFRDIDAIEDVLAGARAAASLRGGLVVVRARRRRLVFETRTAPSPRSIRSESAGAHRSG